MPVVNPAIVHTGYWVDQSLGWTLGATITVKSSTANVLIAFLTTLISIAGLQFWDLTAFFYYFIRVQSGLSNGLFHQQQILLRNSSSPSALVLAFTRLAWAWRADKKVWLRCLWPVCITALVTVVFIAAGLFSSQVVTSENLDILISSSACGWISKDFSLAPGAATLAYERFLSQTMSSSIHFSDTCYNSTDTYDPGCSVFYQNKAPLVNVTHVPCPFGEGMCPYAPALYMDTGLLDSQSYWGINSDSSDRLQTRRAVTCAPIKTEGFVTEVPADVERSQSGYGRDPLPGENEFLWHYGGYLRDGNQTDSNITQYKSSYGIASELQITTNALGYYGEAEAQTQFIPIPEMSRDDADVIVTWIWSNSLMYNTPIDDPIFSAHQPWTTTQTQNTITVYRADKPAGVLGCTHQLQYCNPSNNKCTNLTTSNAAREESPALGLNAQQNATLYLLDYVYVDIAIPISYGPLRAKEVGSDTDQSSLPANQWEIEAQSWVHSTIAASQQFLADYAIGPQVSNPDSGKDLPVDSPATPQEQKLCDMLKMKAPIGYSNISVFGLSFTIAICGLIILLNQVLPRCLLLLWRRKQIMSRRISSWTQDGVLQTQRAAFEQLGVGEWTGLERDIPTASAEQKFAALSEQLERERTNPSISKSKTWMTEASTIETPISESASELKMKPTEISTAIV